MFLAIKLDTRLATLIEVKAIGLELKEAHVKQAVDYAANQGVDWVLLTNGVRDAKRILISSCSFIISGIIARLD